MQTPITNRRVFDRYMTEPDEKRLFSTIRRVNCPWARRDLAWMMLARHTGMRIGTLVRLTVGDARQAINTGYLTIDDDDAKGGRGYQVLVTRPVLRALRSLLTIRKAVGRTMGFDDALIVGRQGGFVTPRLLQLRMKKWLAAANLNTDASPHWWRHTLAKRIMKNSTARHPEAIVQMALGHTDPRSTRIYSHPDRDDFERAMNEVAR